MKHLVIAKSWFMKRVENLITYKIGDKTSQIDYTLFWRTLLKEIKNCKVINGENVAIRHRFDSIDYEIKIEKMKKRKEKIENKIWW